MDRDETIAFWQKCEEARSAERQKRLGTAKREAESIAHQQAKAIWNGWAEDMLSRRRQLANSGKWNAKIVFDEHRDAEIEVANNKETADWIEAARIDFSGYTFSSNETDFSGFIFPHEAFFRQALFEHDTDFSRTIFHDFAWFSLVTFRDFVNFASATINKARFRRTLFEGSSNFVHCTFEQAAHFAQSTFSKWADFNYSRFEQGVDFRGIHVLRIFELKRSEFGDVPQFDQAYFQEAPRLDNLIVIKPVVPPYQITERKAPKSTPAGYRRLTRLATSRLLTWPGRVAKGILRRVCEADRDAPAHWRALKRLAIQGHDTDRELEFFSGEVRSARFAGDWPLPWPVWKASVWGGFLRFWAGLLYQIFSNFGRSLARPFLAWALCVVIFAAYFLGQNEQIAALRKPQRGSSVSQYALTAWNALASPPYCYPGNAPYAASSVPKEEGFSGLVEKARSSTNLVNEALSIAYHNAVIVLDSSGDSAHRAFGCLYGVERYGDNPVAFVPRNVAIASGIQKLLSAVFIFLFGLAVRNMLKVK